MQVAVDISLLLVYLSIDSEALGQNGNTHFDSAHIMRTSRDRVQIVTHEQFV